MKKPPSGAPKPLTWTVDDAAIKSGEIPHIKIGKCIRIPRAAIAEMLIRGIRA